MEQFFRRMGVAVAIAFLAGCASNPASNGPIQSSLNPLQENSAGTVARRGLMGPNNKPANLRELTAPRGWPKPPGEPILFVSDVVGSTVTMYDPNTPNPSPEGSITNGLYNPSGLAVDKSGTLYVSNFGPTYPGSLSVYPVGQSSPTLTITHGINGPEGIAVDKKGDVFVANTNYPYDIVAYKRGQTTPFETITLDPGGQAVGLAVDSHNNIWAAEDTINEVVEIPAGSSSVQNKHLSNLSSPIGISIGQNDRIYVTNLGSPNYTYAWIAVYKAGSTTPVYTITKGLGIPPSSGPTLNGLTYKNWLFQSNAFDDVVGYKKGKKKPFSTIIGLGDPVGIASSPLVAK
jgi:hypothetical protein